MTPEETAAYQKAYRQSNKEKLACQAKERYEANKERELARAAEYKSRNRELLCQKEKVRRDNWSEEQKAKDAAYRKAYRESHREECAARSRLWYENNREIALERNRNKSDQQKMFTSSRTRAKKKGLPHTLVLEDIQIPEFCPYLGLPLFTGDGAVSSNSPSLDRIIPELGYVPGNVRVISFLANTMKQRCDEETLLAFADGVYRLHGKQGL